jgi:hypothetical protein
MSNNYNTMNIIIIILGILVVLLSYYIYRLVTAPPSYINNTYLGQDQSKIPTINPSNINSPSNAIYTMGFWVFINTFSSAISEASPNGYFLTYGNDTTGSVETQNVCAFSMDATKPTMYAHVLINDTTTSNSSVVQKITITDNFPIQTWTYVLVSVNSYYADCYINGKLVVSSQLNSNSVSVTDPAPTKDANKLTLTMYGAKDVDVYITKLFWISNATDPQTAWNYYNQGNGNATSSGVSSTYHLEVELLKDSNPYQTWRLF